jgi:NAD(P)-dependent dehydrogenase (short-subunit alcohol dehydrogenase family)
VKLENKLCVLTGGAGMLAEQFALAIMSEGGKVFLLDIDKEALNNKIKILTQKYPNQCEGITTDITNELSVTQAKKLIINNDQKISVLINIAANNPKIESNNKINFSRLENFQLSQWNNDISVGLTGAFICAKIFGTEMAKKKQGIIVNIASDLSIIAPDQRIYREDNLKDDMQPVKPITYSVVKSGLIGLTKYLATYWADQGVRVNALSPGGVFANQPEEFIDKLTNLIPMGRMANLDEYNSAIIFLCSDASSYMTGTNLVIDGGRTCW